MFDLWIVLNNITRRNRFWACILMLSRNSYRHRGIKQHMYTLKNTVNEQHLIHNTSSIAPNAWQNRQLFFTAFSLFRVVLISSSCSRHRNRYSSLCPQGFWGQYLKAAWFPNWSQLSLILAENNIVSSLGILKINLVWFLLMWRICVFIYS